jgi:hypothetical protein
MLAKEPGPELTSRLTHETFVCQGSISSKMEKNGHVVPVVCGIESSNIDQGVTLTVPKVLRVEGRSPVVLQIYPFAIGIYRWDVSFCSCC